VSGTLSHTELPVVSRPQVTGSAATSASIPVVAVVGNPNAGKTSLFNRLTGLRAKTANFSGTTIEHRSGAVQLSDLHVTLLDLPGLYGLEAVTPDEQIAAAAVRGELRGHPAPSAFLLVMDATNLERNLFLVSQVLELGRPAVVAVNMIDAAEKEGLSIDIVGLSSRLGCEVVAVSARTGQGISELSRAIEHAIRRQSRPTVEAELAACGSCHGCRYAARYDWADSVRRATVRGDAAGQRRLTEAVDRVATHRVAGMALFGLVMALTFLLIFWFAQYPMDMIDSLFGLASKGLAGWLPEGDFSSLVTDGVIGGAGSVVVFLPQICLLFFVLALLEDSGYMARAALVMDRMMRRVGLSGKAFVPMLSAHACAIPAIMSTRVMEDRRDRLAAIMVIPLLTCSARVPVYALVTALLFPHDPVKAALVFAAAYGLGILAALAMGWVFKKTLLKGPVRPLVIELPNYRRPSIRNALVLTYDRAAAFLKTAGTTILVISLATWALATYPKTPLEQMPGDVQAKVSELAAAGDDDGVERLVDQVRLENSFAGRLGRAVEPVFAPLGFDWKMSVGVLSSFFAREVVVSTLGVLYGLGPDGDSDSLRDSLSASRRADGSPMFTTATCLSLLVFYVLAMQCLPTQAVTRRETGSWKWPALQLGYMTALAYTAALVVFQTASLAGW
jgi:ferrous iron transport protein B